MTVRSYAAKWAHRREGRKASTQKQYQDVIGFVLRQDPYWLDTQLRAIHVVQARNFGSMHPYVVPVLRAMFNDARREGLTTGDNPFAGLKLAGSQGRKNILPLTNYEVWDLAAIAGSKYGHLKMGKMVLAAAWMGLRPGELWAAQYGDYDPLPRVLHIHRRVYRGKVDVPKGNKWRRVVVPGLLEPCFTDGPPGELVFPGPNGGYWKSSTFADHWHPIRSQWQTQVPADRLCDLAEARGKPNLDFYELRHFCATLLLDKGITPEDVAIHLGHSDGGKLVRELYGHPDHDKARERVREVLNNG